VPGRSAARLALAADWIVLTSPRTWLGAPGRDPRAGHRGIAGQAGLHRAAQPRQIALQLLNALTSTSSFILCQPCQGIGPQPLPLGTVRRRQAGDLIAAVEPAEPLVGAVLALPRRATPSLTKRTAHGGIGRLISRGGNLRRLVGTA
jgi:hypothetical protein